MNLFKLSYLNFKKSKKDYGIYLFTLILSIIIFYVFNSISDKQMMAMLLNSDKFAPYLELFTILINIFTFFVMCIFAYLIIYASKFLFKRRKKEFGLYQLLGMSKQQINLMLFYETVILGFISIGVGLVLGLIISQGVNYIIVNALLNGVSVFKFTFSLSTLIKTILYFLLMYLIVFIFNGITISHTKIINLNQSKAKLSNLDQHFKLNLSLFFIGILILADAYYIVSTPSIIATNFSMINVAVIFGIVGTYCLIKGLSRVIYGLAVKNQNFYYKGINSYTIKSLANKFNQHAGMFSVVSISLFICICIFGVSMSFKTSYAQTIESLQGVDAAITYYLDTENNESIEINFIQNQLIKSGMNLKNLKDTLEYPIYDSPYSLAALLGKDYDSFTQQYPNMYLDATLNMIKLSDYNNLATINNQDMIQMNPNEFAFVSDTSSDAHNLLYEMILKNNPSLIFEEVTATLNSQELYDGRYDNNGGMNGLFLVVSDELIQTTPVYKQLLITNYIDDSFIEINDEYIRNYCESNHLFYSLASEMNESSAFITVMMVFVGIYIGIVFTICCGAILSLNMLAETMDDQDTIHSLYKLGTPKKMVVACYLKQMAAIFIIPLILSIIDSFFGLGFSLMLFSNVLIANMEMILLIALFILITYGAYYLIATFSCKCLITSMME